MSKRVIQEVLEGLLGVRMALGSLSAKEREVSEALREPWVEAKEAVRQAAVKNADETGWYLSGDLKWLWIGTTPEVAVFQVQEHRDQEAMKELLGEKPQGMVGSDRFGAYTPIPLEQRQLCWAHLKRDCRGWWMVEPRKVFGSERVAFACFKRCSRNGVDTGLGR